MKLRVLSTPSSRNPGWAIGWLIPVLAAFVVVGGSALRGPKALLWRLLPILAISTAVGLTQIRGVPIVVAISIPVLGLILVKAHNSFPSTSPILRGLAMAVLVVSLSGVIPPVIGATPDSIPNEQASKCDILPGQIIAAIPPGSRVLGPLDLGPELLRRFPKVRSWAAPYHRNNAGNLLTMRAAGEWLPEEAATALRAANVEVLIVCDASSPPAQGSSGVHCYLADESSPTS